MEKRHHVPEPIAKSLWMAGEWPAISASLKANVGGALLPETLREAIEVPFPLPAA